MTRTTAPEKPRSTLAKLSKPARRVMLDTYRELKDAQEHKHHDRKVCEIARWRWDHCKHGSFVGDWAGPDHLCGPCEDGVSDFDYALGAALNHQARHVAAIRDAMAKAAVDALTGHPDAEWLTAADAFAATTQACEISGRRFW